MLGMVGTSGTFGAVFFVTPELFPTNMITQASGLSSFMGRLGGMLAPFMTDLEKEISWSHCQTTTSRKSPPSIWFCVCEMACRSLWRPWLAKPSLWKWSPQTLDLLKMWRPRFRIKKAFHRPAVSYLCWQAAGGWPHSVWLQHPDGVHFHLVLRLRGGCSLSFVLVSCGHIFFPTLTISVLYFNQNCSKWFYPIMYMHISCVGICVHGFMNPMPS